jgi:hypothetical protein
VALVWGGAAGYDTHCVHRDALSGIKPPPCAPLWLRLDDAGICAAGRRRENEMRVFVASLIVLSVLFFWDKDYNSGKLLDGLDSMRRSISTGYFIERGGNVEACPD